ncbi:MAG: hypothetical protein RL521_407, partial [Bacteroidota bacterium]
MSTLDEMGYSESAMEFIVIS